MNKRFILISIVLFLLGGFLLAWTTAPPSPPANNQHALPGNDRSSVGHHPDSVVDSPWLR